MKSFCFLIRLITVPAIFFFSSCETIVEIELPEKPPSLVVNCFFNPDSVWKVNVSKSQHIFDNAGIQKINNAKISLYEGSALIDNPTLVSDGNYVSSKNLKPETGKNYKITVSADGFKNIESSDFAPVSTQILKVDTGTVFRQNQKYFEMKIKFKDNPSVKNYYNIQIFAEQYRISFDSLGQPIKDTANSEIIPYSFESNDIIFGEHQNWFGNEGAIFTDEIFASKGEYQLSIFANIYIYQYDFSSGHSSVTKSESNVSKFYIHLKSVSESYYKYVASYQNWRQSNGDPFSQPVQVYNNISNGYGIFAGYSSALHIVNLD